MNKHYFWLFIVILGYSTFSVQANKRTSNDQQVHLLRTLSTTASVREDSCIHRVRDMKLSAGTKQVHKQPDRNIYQDGAIIRTDPSKKEITLVFTAADKSDGANTILRTLKKHKIKGGFFFTGEFYERFPQVIQRLKADGHYVGGHSYGHLLYAAWENRDSLLVTREEFESDLLKSYETMSKAGIGFSEAKVFIPPYEYYNKQIVDWANDLGVQVINFTPGTLTNADYTTPDMPNYRSSEVIYNKVMEVEAREGLNGHIMLIHLGTAEERTDKFYEKPFDKLIRTLKKKGYSFIFPF